MFYEKTVMQYISLFHLTKMHFQYCIHMYNYMEDKITSVINIMEYYTGYNLFLVSKNQNCS